MEGTEKIIALAKELVAECEAQGFSTQSINCKHINIWDHGNGIKIENVFGEFGEWEIREGRVQEQPVNINKLRTENGLEPIPSGEADFIPKGQGEVDKFETP